MNAAVILSDADPERSEGEGESKNPGELMIISAV